MISRTDVRCYVVGGFIRDSLLGIKTLDLDIAVQGNALEIGITLAHQTKGKCITLDKKRGIYRVITNTFSSEIQIDIVEVTGSIQKNLSERDFTINSMAIDISNFTKSYKNTIGINEILDPYNGVKNLESGELHVTSQESLRADPIRLIRAIRIASQLNLTIPVELKSKIAAHAHLITRVSNERTRTEFLNILKLKNSGVWLRIMDELGLLTQIIPEIEWSKKISQPQEHYWDVFNHIIETVTKIEEIFEHCLPPKNQERNEANPLLSYIPVYEDMYNHFNIIIGNGHTRIVTSKLASLLHDIAKPMTKTIDPTGKIRFLGHAEEGAIISEKILKNLKCSNTLIKTVSTQVKYHLRPGQISPKTQMPSNKAMNKYFRDLSTVSIDTLYLNMADYMAARGPLIDEYEWKDYCSGINHILKNGLIKNTPDKIPKLLSGQDIMNRLNLNSSPLIGEILLEVREAQDDGIIKNKDEALIYIEKFVSLGE